MKSWCLLFLLCWAPLLTHADEGRYQVNFRSPNGQYELRLLQTTQTPAPATWGLYQKVTGRQLYTLAGFLADKTVYVANDGQVLAVVDDYSQAEATDSVEVLSFYHHGVKIRGYRLDELVCSSSNISSSASHFTWFASSRYHTASRQLTLTTYELNTLTFQLESGALISSVRSPVITPTTLLVYGKVKAVGPNRYDMEVCHRVYGSVPQNGHLQFTSKKPLWDYVTVLVENGQQVEGKSLTEGWILNQCSYKLERASSTVPVSNRPLNERRLKHCP